MKTKEEIIDETLKEFHYHQRIRAQCTNVLKVIMLMVLIMFVVMSLVNANLLLTYILMILLTVTIYVVLRTSEKLGHHAFEACYYLQKLHQLEKTRNDEEIEEILKLFPQLLGDNEWLSYP